MKKNTVQKKILITLRVVSALTLLTYAVSAAEETKEASASTLITLPPFDAKVNEQIAKVEDYKICLNTLKEKISIKREPEEEVQKMLEKARQSASEICTAAEELMHEDQNRNNPPKIKTEKRKEISDKITTLSKEIEPEYKKVENILEKLEEDRNIAQEYSSKLENMLRERLLPLLSDLEGRTFFFGKRKLIKNEADPILTPPEEIRHRTYVEKKEEFENFFSELQILMDSMKKSLKEKFLASTHPTEEKDDFLFSIARIFCVFDYAKYIFEYYNKDITADRLYKVPKNIFNTNSSVIEELFEIFKEIEFALYDEHASTDKQKALVAKYKLYYEKHIQKKHLKNDIFLQSIIHVVELRETDAEDILSGMYSYFGEEKREDPPRRVKPEYEEIHKETLAALRKKQKEIMNLLIEVINKPDGITEELKEKIRKETEAVKDEEGNLIIDLRSDATILSDRVTDYLTYLREKKVAKSTIGYFLVARSTFAEKKNLISNKLPYVISSYPWSVLALENIKEEDRDLVQDLFTSFDSLFKIFKFSGSLIFDMDANSTKSLANLAQRHYDALTSSFVNGTIKKQLFNSGLNSTAFHPMFGYILEIEKTCRNKLISKMDFGQSRSFLFYPGDTLGIFNDILSILNIGIQSLDLLKEEGYFSNEDDNLRRIETLRTLLSAFKFPADMRISAMYRSDISSLLITNFVYNLEYFIPDRSNLTYFNVALLLKIYNIEGILLLLRSRLDRTTGKEILQIINEYFDSRPETDKEIDPNGYVSSLYSKSLSHIRKFRLQSNRYLKNILSQVRTEATKLNSILQEVQAEEEQNPLTTPSSSPLTTSLHSPSSSSPSSKPSTYNVYTFAIIILLLCFIFIVFTLGIRKFRR